MTELDGVPGATGAGRLTPAQAGRVWEASEERARRRPALAGVICVGAACATVVVMVVVAGTGEAKSGGVRVHREDGSGSISNPSGERDMKHQHNRSVGGLATIAAVGVLALAGDVCAQQAVQWRVEDGGNGHWYRYVSTTGTWAAAQAAAESAGGHLATLHSATEANFIRSLGASECYIGLFQDTRSPDYTEPAGAWRWITGEALTYTNWRLGVPGQTNEPNDYGGTEHWAHLLAGTATITWNDYPAAQLLHSCTEWSADCNADGIVDHGQILVGQLVDANANGVPDICEVDPCPGDITGGGTVDSIDISIILGAWGTAGQGEFDADVDDNGTVDALDLGVVLSGWGSCP